jgi:anti-sigma factor RsiW
MLDDRYIELIDDYLDGILSQEETDKLKAELKENQELKDLFALVQLTRESIRLSGQKELVQKIHEEFINDSNKEKNKGKVVNLKISPWSTTSRI